MLSIDLWCRTPPQPCKEGDPSAGMPLHVCECRRVSQSRLTRDYWKVVWGLGQDDKYNLMFRCEQADFSFRTTEHSQIEEPWRSDINNRVSTKGVGGKHIHIRPRHPRNESYVSNQPFIIRLLVNTRVLLFQGSTGPPSLRMLPTRVPSGGTQVGRVPQVSIYHTRYTISNPPPSDELPGKIQANPKTEKSHSETCPQNCQHKLIVGRVLENQQASYV